MINIHCTVFLRVRIRFGKLGTVKVWVKVIFEVGGTEYIWVNKKRKKIIYGYGHGWKCKVRVRNPYP